MVTVTRLDGSVVVLNADLIESIEAVPDTVITLVNHRKVVVREPAEVVVERVLAYQRAVRGPERVKTGVGTEDAPAADEPTADPAPQER
ncbi:flagellar FlbD family protein [Sphaerobacter sp.]|uniref:flagellar FlbD family protein n=1 Tax=Sphaerobacter sp. TaxID=2099654 RepID=UPI0025DFFE73|nr:flagellar FlbD family protein [Sphaerobacter sp.]